MSEKILTGPTSQPVLPRPHRLQKLISVEWLIIGTALLVRLLLLPVTFHGWDLPVLAWSSRIVALGDLNVYDTGLRQWIQTGWNRPELVSPVSHGPLFFYLYGAWMWLVGLTGLFPLANWTTADPAGLNIQHITVLKIPNLAFDFLAAWCLSRLFEGWQRRAMLALWLFAPILVFTTYAAAQNDVYMVSCVCLALYLANKALEQNRSGAAYLAMLALSAGAAFKLFPLFFMLPAAIILGKQTGLTLWESRGRIARLLLAGLGPVGLLFGVLTLFSKSFLNSVLFSWEANLLGAVGFPSGPGGFLSWFWVAYWVLLAQLVLSTGRDRQFGLRELVIYLGGVIFIYAVISAYPARFLIWMLPFLLIMLVQHPKLYPAYLLITLHFLVGMFNQGFDIYSVLAQRDKELYLAGSSKSFLSRILPWQQILTVSTAVFIVTLVCYYLYYIGNGSIQAVIGAVWKKFATSGRPNPGQVQIKWYWWLLPFVVVFGAIGLLFGLAAGDSGIRRLAQVKSERVIAPLVKGTLVEQPFVAPAGKLEKVELSFATYTRYNLSKVEFRLYTDDVARTELARTTIDTLYIKNSDYYPVKLANPVELTKPTPLVFSLSSPDGTRLDSIGLFGASLQNINNLPGTGLPLWADNGPNDRVGLTAPARINGTVSDQIAVFRAAYSIDWGARARVITTLFGNTPLFTAGYALVCGLLALGLVALGLRLRKINKIE